MVIVLLGIGLAKGVFALHGVEVAGWREMIAKLMPCAIGMGLVTVESVTWKDFLEWHQGFLGGGCTGLSSLVVG